MITRTITAECDATDCVDEDNKFQPTDRVITFGDMIWHASCLEKMSAQDLMVQCPEIATQFSLGEYHETVK